MGFSKTEQNLKYVPEMKRERENWGFQKNTVQPFQTLPSLGFVFFQVLTLHLFGSYAKLALWNFTWLMFY